MTRSVARKLGWRDGLTARLWQCPVDVEAAIGLPIAAGDDADILIGFVAAAGDVAPRLAEMRPHYRPGRKLWFAYPKKSGPIRTDIDRDHGWEALAEIDFLPVMQVAIDPTWSAIRFRPRAEIANVTRKF